ncbi:MAG: SusD/RagB family nutrient-binding outer membrane lipoprotein, partial [Chitinophagaceae bacterium]
MNKHYKFLLIMLSSGLILFQSCSKDYFDLNENPNQVTTASLASLLSTATHKTGINSYNVGSIISNYVQYTANPSAVAASDIYQEVDFSGTWDAIYFAMADINDMKALAIEQNSSEYLGVANVLLSYNLSLVNDLWGDVPFSEAFNGENFTPKYDSQEEVYKATMGLLDSAISQLARTDAVIKLQGAKDLIHGGARPKWLLTAHALKARLLNKVSKTASYSPSAVLASVTNAYKSNADDAGMGSFFTRNPWAQVAVNNAGNTLGGWLSEQFIDHLNGTTYGIFDPRLRKISRPTVNNVYIGTVNGAGNRPPGNNTVKDENYVDSTSPWTGTFSPLLLVSYAEIKFIEAEAALAADPARAYTAYLAGINANMEKLQVPAGAEKTAYLAAASVGAASLT